MRSRVLGFACAREGPGRLCPGDLVAGPDPIELFDDEPSAAVVLRKLAAGQTCESFVGS
jgi:hypothetical protein